MYKIDSSGVRRTAVHSRRLPNLKLDIYVQFRSWTGVPAYWAKGYRIKGLLPRIFIA